MRNFLAALLIASLYSSAALTATFTITQVVNITYGCSSESGALELAAELERAKSPSTILATLRSLVFDGKCFEHPTSIKAFLLELIYEFDATTVIGGGGGEVWKARMLYGEGYIVIKATPDPA
jgi:hypothetical protein